MVPYGGKFGRGSLVREKEGVFGARSGQGGGRSGAGAVPSVGGCFSLVGGFAWADVGGG